MLRLIFIAVLLAVSPANGAEVTAQADPEAIADLRVANGAKDIAAAWLIAPTQRYVHFAQGSDYEAGGLRLGMADGRVLTLMLDDSHVFEDRRPRLADLDNDGRDEIVLVLTSLTQGASLAVYSVAGNSILLKAKTPFIGQPRRWLNPAGIADFDGDGQLDVALVAMPHLAKRLEMWTLSDRGLRKNGGAEDFSNHRNGSRFTAMSAVGDFDGDGIMDLAIPDGSRRVIRLVGLAGMSGNEINRFALKSPADGIFELTREGDGWVLRVGTEAGMVEELNF